MNMRRTFRFHEGTSGSDSSSRVKAQFDCDFSANSRADLSRVFAISSSPVSLILFLHCSSYSKLSTLVNLASAIGPEWGSLTGGIGASRKSTVDVNAGPLL